MIYQPELEHSTEAVEEIIRRRAKIFMADGRYRISGNHIHAYVIPFMGGAQDYWIDVGRFDDVVTEYERITHHPDYVKALSGYSPAMSVNMAIASTPKF